MSSTTPSALKPPADRSKEPLIPESAIDAPSQRLYIISLGLLCQAIKVFDWLHSLVVERTTNLTLKWVLVDIAYCLVLKRLRIPRLNYAAAAVVLQILMLCLVDGVLFGTVHIGVSSYSLTSSARDFYRKELSTNGRMVNLRDMFSNDDHLKGEHTVRMSPISTAKLNPDGHSYCLSPSANMVLIPVLLNNTKPSHIRYGVTRPGSDKIDYVDLGARELRAIEQARLEALQLTKASASAEDEDSDVDWDGDDEDFPESLGQDRLVGFSRELEKTQSVMHLRVNKPGTVRLERVLDSTTNNMARVFYGEVSVVPCPQAAFVPDAIVKGNNVRCVGAKEELAIKVFGVPPLSLRWHRDVNGRREHFSVDRIEGEPDKQGQAHDLRIPLDMPLNNPGSHTYVLDSLSDGLGNLQSLTPRKGETKDATNSNNNNNNAVLAKDTTRSVTVLKRAAISFRDCAPGKPASLLVGGETPLAIAARESDAQDGPWDVKVRYQPAETGKKAPKPWVKTLTTPAGRNQLTLSASAPGEYEIVNVKGQYCPGDVLSPETCRVVQQAYPSADIDWKRIHECSGDTGVSAYLVLHGRPPFQVFYQQKRNNEAPKEMSRSFQGARGEITLQPESSGNYTYTFTALSDANYRRVALAGPSITQVVHPLAAASFGSGGGGKREINSCEGDVVGVDVDLRGDGPWNLEVQVVGPKGSETLRLKDLKKSRERIQVPIPAVVNSEGGSFQIDLVSVEDSYGCKKDLAVPGMSVNVRRVKPNARFYTKDGKRETTVLENSEAKLPLRLTGEGPWRVKYQLSNPESPVRSALLRNPNDFLTVRENGVYRLTDVSDSQCPGSIVVTEAEFKVDWIARPAAKLSADTEVAFHKHNGSHVRAPICEGKEDHVDLDMTGRPPFQIGYNIASRNSDAGGTRILDQPVISSIQSRTRIQLLTSQAGRIYYEVKQIGDANYPLSQNTAHVIPRHERLLFEQEVIGRPSAQFKNPTRLSHCLRDTFVPTDAYSTDDVIVLEGKAPFHVELSVKNLAASEVHRQTVELWDAQWKVSLPNYVFTSIGPHLVTIESVRDASSCAQKVPDPLRTSIWVDVAESAAIVPFDRREHFCVGDITQFQLEGIPPWTIGYNANNKQHEQVAKHSPFALVQQHPGPFTVTSISHQQQQCKTSVENINFEVHALPAAQVAQGRDYFEDIHEGSQAQIVFTLVGEPPFTFTYQRSEAPARKGAKPGKVLETHTVSGVMSHDYSIYSALEGTWTVTFISDKYCRYPPAQPDSLGDKTKA